MPLIYYFWSLKHKREFHLRQSRELFFLYHRYLYKRILRIYWTKWKTESGKLHRICSRAVVYISAGRIVRSRMRYFWNGSIFKFLQYIESISSVSSIYRPLVDYACNHVRPNPLRLHLKWKAVAAASSMKRIPGRVERGRGRSQIAMTDGTEGTTSDSLLHGSLCFSYINQPWHLTHRPCMHALQEIS